MGGISVVEARLEEDGDEPVGEKQRDDPHRGRVFYQSTAAPSIFET